MAVSNQLEVSFQYQQINNKFEFYLISTTEKYIPFGAKCLDFKDGKIESGLNEQIEALKTAKPHYFKQDNNNSGHFFGISPNNKVFIFYKDIINAL